MKHSIKRTAACLLAATLALTPVASASEALGEELRDKTTAVAPGVTVTNQSLWSAAYRDLRTEHYIDYTPGGSVSAVVSYGTYVTSRESMKAMAAALEARGLRVVGGINAGFFNTNNGTPIGLVITDGLLQSANPNYYAVGFKADGTALMGQPTITLTASWTTRETTVLDEATGLETVVPPEDKTITLSGFNKVRVDGGYYLYSDTFAATTKNNVSGVDVVLRPVEVTDPETGLSSTPAGLPVSGSVVCEVVSVRDSVSDTAIPAGCFVLSMNSNSGAAQLALLSALQAGDQVTLNSAASGEWGQVVHAVSGLYSLVENGQVASGLSAASNPYTAVGLRPDGSVVLYTVDGRQSGYSIGATYKQVAARMIELGCVTAIAMDGGGSTSFGTTYADFDAFQMVNRGSDGSARAVSTCLFLVTSAGATGELDHFYVSAGNDVVLMGSSTTLNSTAVDTNYYPMSWNGELTWESMLGQVTRAEDGTLIYTSNGKSGTDTVTGASGGATGSVDLLVVDALSSISVKNEETGAAVASLTLTPDDVVDLSVSALYRNLAVSCADTDFTWTAEGTAGTIDETGRFTAAGRNGTGTIKVTGGGITASIPVTVAGGDPFNDTEGHWAQDFITQLYQLGITTGETNADGSVSFYPNRSITRGELLTLVVRMLGEDTAAYEGVELPFADAGSIHSWLLPYVKTAYSLGLLKGDQVGDALYAKVGDNVTREAAMVIIGRTLGYTRTADLTGFTDGAQVSDWAQEYVQTLVALGVVNGSDGKLNPKNGILRGEVAKIITVTISLPPAEEETPVDPETEDPLETVPEESAPVETDPVEPTAPEEGTVESADPGQTGTGVEAQPGVVPFS